MLKPGLDTFAGHINGRGHLAGNTFTLDSLKLGTQLRFGVINVRLQREQRGTESSHAARCRLDNPLQTLAGLFISKIAVDQVSLPLSDGRIERNLCFNALLRQYGNIAHAVQLGLQLLGHAFSSERVCHGRQP
jgi:hypothetical protein